MCWGCCRLPRGSGGLSGKLIFLPVETGGRGLLSRLNGCFSCFEVTGGAREKGVGSHSSSDGSLLLATGWITAPLCILLELRMDLVWTPGGDVVAGAISAGPCLRGREPRSSESPGGGVGPGPSWHGSDVEPPPRSMRAPRVSVSTGALDDTARCSPFVSVASERSRMAVARAQGYVATFKALSK